MSRGPYAKRFECLDCGEPVGMPNSRCPNCRKAHKAAYQKGYMPQYHAQHRPPATPLPQRGGHLPPIGSMVYDDDGSRVQCHVCGEFFGSLVKHIRIHGLDAARYKERYGLARGTSLLSLATAEKQRQAAIARDLSGTGIKFGQDGHLPPNRKGIDNRQQSRIRSSANSAKRKQSPHISDQTRMIIADLRAGHRGSAVAERYGLTRQRVQQIRVKYGIPRSRVTSAPQEPNPRIWTDGQVAYLVAHHDDPNQDIASAIGRTLLSVRTKRAELIQAGEIPRRGSRWSEPGTDKRSPYSATEQEIFHDPSIPHADAAAMTGRSVGSIQTYRSLHNIKVIRGMGSNGMLVDAWSDDDIAYLVAHADDRNKDVAAVLGRSPKSVKAKRSRLISAGRIAPQQAPNWTEAEDRYLIEHWGDRAKEVAKKLHRTVSAINTRRETLRKRGIAPS